MAKQSKLGKAWPWILTIVIGAIFGAAVGTGYVMLNKSHTTAKDLVSPPFGGRKFVRILVLGEDNTSKMRATGRGLSDTIMVAAVDLEHRTVRGVSVPRDTRVDLPGHGIQKINAAYPLEGANATMEAVKSVLGIDSIDYYIKTDIAGLKGIVDAVGGVGIDVEKDMHYTDRHGGLYINLKKGYRHLDGDKALQYVRFRHDALGDITRIQRQQKFLRALARQMFAPSNWPKLPAIVNEIYNKGYVDTNLNLKDIEALAKITRDITPDKVEMEMAPGVPQNIHGVSYWIVDPEQTMVLAKRMLYFTPADALKVEILNGSGAAGVAQDAASKVEQAGFVVASTGNAPNYDYERTQIILHNPKASVVEIARAVGATEFKTDNTSTATADNEKPANGVDMTVIIGKDYRQ